MEYEIIATVGPTSRTPEILSAMIAAGATALRINTSHLSVEEVTRWLSDTADISARGQDKLPIVLDLQGSKWRLGECSPVVFSKGEQVFLAHSAVSSQSGELPVPHADFFRAADMSDGRILLNDAKVALKVERSEPHRLEAVVTRGGEVTSFKGITFAQSPFRTESLSEKDAEVIARTRDFPFVRYALSYVKDAAEMQSYRTLIGRASYLIAKLERPDAVVQAVEIARSADELWLCRGDLGAEMGLRDMAQAAHELSTRVASLTVPVMLAGQVFEHMTDHESPTRAEVCSLYDALHAGYRGVVLSDETAIGRSPVESCRVAALFR
jgi:pyruvate kinase